MSRLLSLLLFFIYSLGASEIEFIQLGSRGAGMFSLFNTVLRCLDDYEKGAIAGLEVNFHNRGAYFDRDYGPNWWQYYCEPINIGVKSENLLKRQNSARARTISRQRAHALIEKYIHIKPHIEMIINEFAHANFGNCFVIGVHYRGTDKIIEAPRVAYEEVIKQVQAKVNSLTQEYMIFVASDEMAFIQFIQEAFAGKVCYQKDVIRSSDDKPVHIRAKTNRYKLGEDALTDCLLLSKTDYLIRTSSNLSLWSTYFNPSIAVVDLNERYKQ